MEGVITVALLTNLTDLMNNSDSDICSAPISAPILKKIWMFECMKMAKPEILLVLLEGKSSDFMSLP